jgi:hypothetical protein
MAPVIAIGSSFLVAGSASATVKTAKSAAPTLTVCKNVAGTFKFSVNGKALKLTAQCAAVKVGAGVTHVTETLTPASYKNLKSITVSPSKSLVSKSLKTATVALRLAANGAATVRFANIKTDPQQAGTGLIEVCKWGSDNYVEGSFPFTITAGGATVGTYSVAVGACTGAIPVAAGSVTVTEGSEYPYYLSAVTAQPSGNLASENLTGQSATFNVADSTDVTTTANFTNDTYLNQFKVCKILSNNDGSLAGQWFKFNVSWTFTPPNGAAPISDSGVVSVQAVAHPGETCVQPVGLWPNGIPVDSIVTISEQAFPDTSVSSVYVVPAKADAGSTATTAVLEEPAIASGLAEAVFTNDPLGVVEVCKNFYPKSYDATYSGTFSVNGGPSFTVGGGACSVPIYVPAGTATVSELSTINDATGLASSDFFLVHVSTVSATDPFGTRLLSGDLGNPASVTVPYGDVGNETVVTFDNVVDPTQFKICKQETSADANLSGSTFTFDYSYAAVSGSVNLTIAPVTAANPTGEVCSGLIWGPAPVDPSGNPIPIAISEESTDIPAVQVTGILYQGNGEVKYVPALYPVSVNDGGTATICFDPGSGINVVTYTNGRTAGSNT